jgi:hypothetical protein
MTGPSAEVIMRLKYLAVAAAFVGALGLISAPASAAPKKRVYSNRDRTVVISRDEDGRTRTRIIIQKRSYLDPGTTPLPSERNVLDYINTPTQSAESPVANTPFGNQQSPLPGPFDLPTRHNPYINGY